MPPDPSLRPTFLSWDVAQSSSQRGEVFGGEVDEKASQHFWLDYFFVRTEAIVSVVVGFPEAWNPTRKCSCLFIYLF